MQVDVCFLRFMHRAKAKGLPGRLTKGAGTHLASWLQPCDGLSQEAAQALLDQPKKAHSGLQSLQAAHGRRCAHARPITDV